MGTRGTLHVYVNGDLKIRQYNQWDSYPTGQFDDICRFFRNKDNVEELALRLSKTRFATEDEWKKVTTFVETGTCDLKDTRLVSQLLTLRNRDYGADILWQVNCMCDLWHAAGGNMRYVLPDWDLVFDGGVGEQEGNYRIDITAKVHDWDVEDVHFSLSGKYHGIARNFDIDYVPGEDEIKAWEAEDD